MPAQVLENESDSEGDFDFAAAAGSDIGGGVGGATGAVVALPNVDDEGTVVINNSTASSDTAGDLGFSTEWVDTRADFFSGLSDGDFIGVTDFAFLGDGSSYDGDFVFQHSDSDGSLRTTFDAVDLTGLSNVLVSFLLGIEGPADFEGDGVDPAFSDTINVYLDTDAGPISLISEIADGDDNFDSIFPVEELGLFSFAIPDSVNSASLVIETSTTSGGEAVGFDNIVFSVVIPEPASFAMVLLAGSLAGAVSMRSRLG